VAKINKVTIVGKICLAVMLWLVTITGTAFGQTCITPKVRVYATAEQEVNASAILLSSVDDASKAANGNPADFSQLNTGIFGSAQQFLKFANTYPAGTPVTVKLSLPTGLLSLLSTFIGGVTVQPFKGGLTQNFLGQWQATLVTPTIKLGTILGALNGAGDKEITVVPTDEFDGIWVSLSGLNIGQNVKVFDAYIEQDAPATGTMGCSTPVDVIAGVRAGTIVGGIANATGTVTNKYDAIDGDLNTAAQLNVGAGVLSEVYHTTVFNTESHPGDYVRMLIEDAGGGLLSLASLSSFTIQLYDGTTPVGSAITNSSGLLSLSLFAPGNTTKQYINIKPPANITFDRIEVQVGGLANAALFTAGLKIYDVQRILAAPVSNIDGVLTTSKTICGGSTSTLSVNNPSSCLTYKWYDAATGGTILQTDVNYTPPASNPSTVTSHQYYVEAGYPGCTEVSTRTPVTLIVNPPPAIATTNHPKVCAGTTSTTLSYTTTNTPDTYSIVWDAPALTAHFANVTDILLPTGGVTDISVVVPANAPPATYTGTIIVKNATTGCLSTGQPFSIDVDALPTQPVINLTP
jgi:hypothetical protein